VFKRRNFTANNFPRFPARYFGVGAAVGHGPELAERMVAEGEGGSLGWRNWANGGPGSRSGGRH
jgi:hypothetical protein